MSQKIPTLKAIRMPKRMPTNFVLSKIAVPPELKDLESMKPKLSFKNQWRIKNCADFIKVPTPINLSLPTPVIKLQKGPKFPITKLHRQQKISDNMKRMDSKIQDYVKERRKIKESKKPELPF